MQAEVFKRDQVTVMFHPDVLSRVDVERQKQLINRSQFIENATKEYLAKLEKNG